ncbi:hypothetical protein PVK06_036881 [Gossypium arboreum]|uniref:TIR domain-containing protein n=1 Tax=Gossypium arboreum TaxID=29729 RepID=A0ABR0NKR6_GOSAR|nr:hypothetical protein PVK06_036881 [Gossypium arboreum]
MVGHFHLNYSFMAYSFMAYSSSSSRQMNHQVFLSFRDTLEKGEPLSPALSQGIASSNLFIIVLSKDYASSKSCSTELSEITDHKCTQGYELTEFLEGTLPAPPRFVTSPEGSLVPNSEASMFIQQDRLLASWLLSTISPSLLPLFTDTCMACDVWNMATLLFAVVTGVKLSRIRHDLHSLKKGTISISKYVAKIQNICDLIKASSSQISKADKVKVVLTGLPLEFDIFKTFASSVESAPSSMMMDPGRGGRSSSGGHGRGHLAQRCYYRFDREYGDASTLNTAPVMALSGSPSHGPCDAMFGEHGWWSAHSAPASLGGRSGPASFGDPGRCSALRQ